MVESEVKGIREKRRCPRVRSLYLTSYTPKKDNRQLYIVSIGRTLDVSEGGAKVETHRELAEGTEVDLDIAVGEKLISARGEVVYTEKLRNGMFGTGIRFTSMASDDRRSLKG
ncbi:MAG: PilZ domain-containing protein [Deltaproteobacteria bacterium]|nr:PilZ domain-containing protein [Deltaproteobacteria bacterium]MBW2072421.1 PilZ domain-containing protein [Deltaproteobacteria bacterium]